MLFDDVSNIFDSDTSNSPEEVDFEKCVENATYFLGGLEVSARQLLKSSNRAFSICAVILAILARELFLYFLGSHQHDWWENAHTEHERVYNNMAIWR